MKHNSLLIVVATVLFSGATFSTHAGLFSSPIDLSKPFICKDISPTPLHITEKGLIMGGVVYPLYNPNAASTPKLTNAIFRSKDNLEEIDVRQDAEDGKVDVSYMKFSINPDALANDAAIENSKIFEKEALRLITLAPNITPKTRVASSNTYSRLCVYERPI